MEGPLTFILKNIFLNSVMLNEDICDGSVCGWSLVCFESITLHEPNIPMIGSTKEYVSSVAFGFLVSSCCLYDVRFLLLIVFFKNNLSLILRGYHCTPTPLPYVQN